MIKQTNPEENPDPLVQQVIDNVNASIYWKDKEGRYLGCNKFVLTMTGLSSREQIIGKTDADLIWIDDAPKLMEADRYVLSHGRYVGEEKVIVADGSEMTVLTVKSQLRDNDDNVIGTIGASLDITAKKEAEKLKFERQQIALQEYERYAQQARKVAHDIKSPLFALKMLIQLSKDLPEDERLLLIRATDSIFDISNNLITDYTVDQSHPSDMEPRQPVLVSDLIAQLLSEKKMQYRNEAIRFELDIDDNAHFVFIHAQRTELRRALSNLINNGVDASLGKEDAVIVLKLAADAETVELSVFDDGGGMSDAALQRIQNRQGFTEGKKDGHGLGLQQVWDMLDHNQGVINVQSFPGVGTAVQLLFPRVDAADWIIQALHSHPDQHIVILDDEKSIHNAWDMRFAPLLKEHPQLKLHHFTQGYDALEFLKTLNAEDKNRAIFLSDYELLKQEKTGLEIIEASGVQRAVLVTSYYADFKIQDAAAKLGVKILPKQLAPVVPIHIESEAA